MRVQAIVVVEESDYFHLMTVSHCCGQLSTSLSRAIDENFRSRFVFQDGPVLIPQP